MNIEERLRGSLQAALESGREWSPSFHREWLAEDGMTATEAETGEITLPDEWLRGAILDAARDAGARENGRSGVEIDERGVKITGPFKITGEVFDLSAVSFPKPIRIRNCRFEGDIRIDDAELRRVVLDDCTFQALFGENTHLQSSLEIKRCTVEGRIWLIRATIGGHLNLQGTTINKDGLLRQSFMIGDKEVSDPAQRVLRCEGAEIRGGLLLRRGFHSRGRLALRRMKVGGVVRTRDARFELSDSALPPKNGRPHITLDLRGATVAGTLDLTSIRVFEGGLDLRDAHVKAFADDTTAWPDPGLLLLDGFVYGRLTDSKENELTPRDHRSRIKWLKLQWKPDLTSEFKPQPWTQVARVLFQMGHDYSARQVLYARECRRNRFSRKSATTRFLGLLIKWTAGHGYKNHRAVFLAMAIWFLSAGIFWSAAELELVGPAQEEVLIKAREDTTFGTCAGQGAAEKVPPGYPRFNTLIYALDVLVPITNFRQREYWTIIALDECHEASIVEALPARLPEGQRERVAKAIVAIDAFRLTQWVTIILGWILTTVAVAGFSGLLEREKS